MTRSNRLWMVPAMLVVAAVAVPMSGCTLLVTFDDPPADASVVTPRDAAPIGDDDDAEADAAASEAGPQPDAVSDAPPGTLWGLPPSPYVNPDGISSLVVPAGCDPCLRFENGTASTSGAFTCGRENKGAGTECGALDDNAVYFCGPTGVDPTKMIGYICPSANPCFANGSNSAICDPCGGMTNAKVATSATNSTDVHEECVTCGSTGTATSSVAVSKASDCI